MNNILSKYARTIHDIAQFLSSNPKVIEGNSLDGKMSMIYFLLRYGMACEKKQYTRFALRMLENLLTRELSDIKKSKADFYSGIAGVGWGIMKLHQEELFESDDLHWILDIIDGKIYYEIENMSRSDLNSSWSLLLGFGLYLKERAAMKEDNGSKSLRIRQYLSIVLYELFEHSQYIRSEEYEKLYFFSTLFYQCSKDKMLVHFDSEELKRIPGLKKTDYTKISKDYKQLKENGQINEVLKYSALFSDSIKEISDDKHDLLKKIEAYAIDVMQQNKEDEKKSNCVQELVDYAVFLIESTMRLNRNRFGYSAIRLYWSKLDDRISYKHN